MTLRRWHLAIAVLCVATIPATRAAAECVSTADPIRAAFKGAAHVFVADVAAVEFRVADPYMYDRVTFRVIERLKGTAGDTPTAFDFRVQKPGFAFKGGQRLLAYISQTDSGWSAACSPTRPVTLDDPEIGFLRRLAAQATRQQPGVPAAGPPAAAPPLDAVIAKQLPGWRVATRKDVSQVLGDVSKGGKPEFLGDVMFQTDFDGDNRQDWAAIVIDEKEQRYRAYYVLNLTTGPRLDLLFEQRWTQRPSDGVIRNPMFLKRPGDTGIAQRRYNTLTNNESPNAPAPAERARLVEAYRRVPAVEIWTGQQGYDADYGHLGDMAYCSSTAYYQSGELKKFRACD